MNLKLGRTDMLLLTSIFGLLLQTLHVTPFNFYSAKVQCFSAKSLLTRRIQKGPIFPIRTASCLVFIMCMYITCSAILFFHRYISQK